MAANREVQRAADRQNGVAQRLEFEPTDVGAPEQIVEGVDLRERRIVLAALLPRRREQNETMELFDRPAVGDESVRQPVDQFRMGGWRRLIAEIVRRVNEAVAEVMLLDAVDQD